MKSFQKFFDLFERNIEVNEKYLHQKIHFIKLGEIVNSLKQACQTGGP
jgi:hypothetical protein